MAPNASLNILGEIRVCYDLEAGRTLKLTITDEGWIIDVYSDDDLIATAGMMADEWAGWVLAR